MQIYCPNNMKKKKKCGNSKRNFIKLLRKHTDERKKSIKAEWRT